MCNSHGNLCTTFVIAGHFDEIITRSGLVVLTIPNEWKHEKTKARKHDHSWASAEIFPRGEGNFGILFIIFKLLRISVPSKTILHWANICFSEHDILGLSKWSFQWITNFVNYITNIQPSNYEQNTHFIRIAPCFWGSFHWFGMLQVRENEISLRNSSGGPEYLRPLEGTLLTM